MVGRADHEGALRANHDEVGPDLLRKTYGCEGIGQIYPVRGGIKGDTCVAGSRVDFADRVICDKSPDEGVLTSTGTEHQDLHDKGA